VQSARLGATFEPPIGGSRRAGRCGSTELPEPPEWRRSRLGGWRHVVRASDSLVLRPVDPQPPPPWPGREVARDETPAHRVLCCRPPTALHWRLVARITCSPGPWYPIALPFLVRSVDVADTRFRSTQHLCTSPYSLKVSKCLCLLMLWRTEIDVDLGWADEEHHSLSKRRQFVLPARRVNPTVVVAMLRMVEAIVSKPQAVPAMPSAPCRSQGTSPSRPPTSLTTSRRRPQQETGSSFCEPSSLGWHSKWKDPQHGHGRGAGPPPGPLGGSPSRAEGRPRLHTPLLEAQCRPILGHDDRSRPGHDGMAQNLDALPRWSGHNPSPPLQIRTAAPTRPRGHGPVTGRSLVGGKHTGVRGR